MPTRLRPRLCTLSCSTHRAEGTRTPAMKRPWACTLLLLHRKSPSLRALGLSLPPHSGWPQVTLLQKAQNHFFFLVGGSLAPHGSQLGGSADPGWTLMASLSLATSTS